MIIIFTMDLIINFSTTASSQIRDKTTNFNHTQITIEADFPIIKINDRVFQIGNLEENFFINFSKIFDVINKGFKFIPCFFNNNFNFYAFCDYLFKEFLITFNKRIFFLKTQKESIRDSTNENVPPISNSSEDTIILNNIIKQLNLNKKADLKFPLQNETLDLEFLIFKELFKIKYSKSHNNITLEEFNHIKKFIKVKPFKIIQCDKNVGFGVISHKL